MNIDENITRQELENDSDIISDELVQKILNEYAKDITYIFNGDGNIYFANSDYSMFQITGGIVVVFDETKLTDGKPASRFFDCEASYRLLFENVYFYSAGL